MSGLRSFSAPTRIVAGLGALERLAEELGGLGAGTVAVVCDEGVAHAGLLDEVVAAAGADVVVLPLVQPDPVVADVEAAAAVARAEGCDAVVGLGGGSALALAKAVALLLRNDSPITAYAGWDKAAGAPAPSIALPTTAGSGSEVSNALVLHDPEQESIVVIRGHGYEPRVAILDGRLLRTLPAGPLVDAALDALSHAVEALSVRGASMFTDALALAAADQLRSVLPRVLEERSDDDLQTLLEASAMANLACGSSGLGLVHALSSATRLRVPHGRANGVLLPWVAAFNRRGPAAAGTGRGRTRHAVLRADRLRARVPPRRARRRRRRERRPGRAREPAASQQQPPRHGGRAGGAACQRTRLTPRRLHRRDLPRPDRRRTAPGRERRDDRRPQPGDRRADRPLPALRNADVAAAVEAARAAFPAWRATPATERAAKLLELVEALGRRQEDLARMDSADNGSPLRDMRIDVAIGMAELRYFAGLALQLRGETIPVANGRLNYTLREPYGVVGRIVPFNHPILFATMKIGAPLVAGNTVVLKPSEQTSLSTLVLAEELARIFPPGVINIVTGYGAEAGDALVAHPDVPRSRSSAWPRRGARSRRAPPASP